jgi:hypothetical protein
MPAKGCGKSFAKLFQDLLRRVRKIAMPGKSPAWPGRQPSQPQRNTNKVVTEITTDEPVHTQLDSFSNAAAR